MEGCKRLPALFAQMSGEAGGNSNAEVSTITPHQPNWQQESPANAQAASAGGGRGGEKKECPEELQAPVADLEKRLQSKTMDLLHFLAVKLSLHLTTHPTIALMQLMRSELRI